MEHWMRRFLTSVTVSLGGLEPTVTLNVLDTVPLSKEYAAV